MLFSLFALVGLLTFGGLRTSVAQTQTLQHAASAPAQASDQYVGSDTCATCHQDKADAFADNPHAKLALKHGSAGACESCHGPGKAHVDGGGDVTKIVRFDKLTPQQIDKTCLSCHANTHPNFLRSPHAQAGVSCLGCHSIHKSAPDTKLLVAKGPTLCYQCHTDIKPAFDMPFHHKVNEGVVSCNDCHNVHGTFGDNNLKSTADQNAICTKCHMETRGPFVYEHPVVRAEGCLSCHTPHGSQNPRLLNMPNVRQLCIQCHGSVAADNIHGLKSMSSSNTCIDCHTMIHGSNLSSTFYK
ncbi:MAG: DmsE family decaheme c-type cytochrome [Acidobacteriaceae bacterium]